MSGGKFEYNQYRISMIAEEIEHVIERMGQPTGYTDWEGKSELRHTYSPEVVAKFKEAIEHLYRAFVYAQRIDWLLSGDDSEECFLRRLEEELRKLENEE